MHNPAARIALVTGSKSIGFEIARQVGQVGTYVLLGARLPGRGRRPGPHDHLCAVRRPAVAQRGWTVAAYTDEGISGTKGRDKRPGLDSTLKDAVRGRFDVAMCWVVDRMERSLVDLLGPLQELHGVQVDSFLFQQAIDTTTPAGRATFGMTGVFAGSERSMIQACIHAGIAMARISPRKEAKPFGRRGCRPRSRRLRAHRTLGVGVGTPPADLLNWAL